MNTFRNIKELITALNREEKLLSEMFKKRKSVNFRYEYALDLVESNDSRIQYLLNRGVIRQNGNNLEIDDLFLQFFEQVLDTNEEINTSYINENLEKLTQNIRYCLCNRENGEVFYEDLGFIYIGPFDLVSAKAKRTLRSSECKAELVRALLSESND